MFPSLYGAHLCSPNTATAALIGIYGTQATIFTPNNVTLILYLISMFALLTFGMANAGTAYVLRGYTRGDSIFLWSDFFRAIKRNFFPCLITGFLDILVLILTVYSTVFYYFNSVNIENLIMLFVSFAMTVVYFVMRFYIYLLLITFKLPPVKLVKNAFIMVFLGIKRNFMAIIGIFIVVLLNVIIFMFVPNIGIILPLFFTVSHGAFIATFAAYPSIKKYMIDPYYEEHPEEKEQEIFEEPIFLDYT
jgi:uncharacterized membrane protein YesL